jgi:hypothetical protein
MTVGSYFTLIILLAVLWTCASWAFNKVMIRFSPKYEARRQLKQQKEYDRRTEKRLKRDTARKARLIAWATSHPDDPAAKAILAEDASSSSSTSSSTDENLDSLEELRRSQQAADDRERRHQDRKVAEQLRSRQLLDWALANPASAEGRRHLEETLLEANKRVESAESSITIVSYGAKGEGPEAIEVATRISEINAQKTSDESLIAEIQAALKRSLSDAK